MPPKAGAPAPPPAPPSPAVQQLQQRILQMCQALPEGVSLEHMKRELKGAAQPDISAAITALHRGQRIVIARDGNTSVIKATSQATQKLDSLGENERLVYDLLEEAGNKGMYLRDIGLRTKLPAAAVRKSISILCSRNVVKELKGVASKTQKLFMLYDLEPSVQVTGGTWYTEAGEYDIGFIKILQHQCYKRIREKRYCSTKSLVDWVASSEISNVPLYEQDVQEILNTLLYDGLIEEVEDMAGGADVLYKATDTPAALLDTPLTSTPCGTCPVFDQCTCSTASAISPYTCPYMKDWMDLF
eukprot:EG_transcript_18611